MAKINCRFCKRKIDEIQDLLCPGSYVQTSNNANPNTLSSVFEKDYVGKITSVTSQGWISTVYSSPYYLLVITAVLFVIPIVIMKIREKNPENS